MLLSYKNYYHSTSSTGINKKESNKQSSGWLFIQWMAVTNLWTTWTRSWACLIHLTITMSPLKWHCNAFKRWIVYLFCVCLLFFFCPQTTRQAWRPFEGFDTRKDKDCQVYGVLCQSCWLCWRGHYHHWFFLISISNDHNLPSLVCHPFTGS